MDEESDSGFVEIVCEYIRIFQKANVYADLESIEGAGYELTIEKGGIAELVQLVA